MKLLLTTNLPSEGIKILKKFFEVEIQPGIKKEELLKIIPKVEVLLVRSETKVTKEILKAAGKLKIIGRAGIGLDNIDLKEAKKRRIAVLNTPDSNSISVAELVFGMLLSLLRNLGEADRTIKEGKWEKHRLIGYELSGKVIGIVGLGKIGKIVARIALAFGMEVLGYDPFLKTGEFVRLKVKKEPKLSSLLKKSDIVTLHVPKNRETINLIGQKELNLMKKNALLINCARGGIVNEENLYHALKKNRIAGAGIDTWENEPTAGSKLQKLPQVLALPHLGASTYEAQTRCTFDLINQILDWYGFETFHYRGLRK